MALCGLGMQAGRNSFPGLEQQIFYRKLQGLWKALLSLPWTVGLDTLLKVFDDCLAGVQSWFTWMEHLLWARPYTYAFFMGLSFRACAYHFRASFWVGSGNKNIAWQRWHQRFKHATHSQDPYALPSQKHLLRWDTCICSLSSPTSGTPFVNFVFH